MRKSGDLQPKERSHRLRSTGVDMDEKEEIRYGKKAATLNKLYKEIKKLENATELRKPGTQVEKTFEDAYEGE